jgi:hypothetical protein
MNEQVQISKRNGQLKRTGPMSAAQSNLQCLNEESYR